jgi:hypothetical protein
LSCGGLTCIHAGIVRSRPVVLLAPADFGMPAVRGGSGIDWIRGGHSGIGPFQPMCCERPFSPSTLPLASTNFRLAWLLPECRSPNSTAPTVTQTRPQPLALDHFLRLLDGLHRWQPCAMGPSETGAADASANAPRFARLVRLQDADSAEVGGRIGLCFAVKDPQRFALRSSGLSDGGRGMAGIDNGRGGIRRLQM